MIKEAIDGLHVSRGHWYIDATFGRGGHTNQILSLGGRVIAFDFDREAYEFGQEKFGTEIEKGDLILINKNFAQMSEVIDQLTLRGQVNHVSGILFDFGPSNDQLLSENRGFSFSSDSELDMRMDQSLGVKAKDLLALLGEKDLIKIFGEYGGELHAKKIAKEIVKERKQGKFVSTTDQLTKIVEKFSFRHSHLHPATKVFLGLRIAVNDEIENIHQGLDQAWEVLEHGRIVTISFHELEDRIVKNKFKKWQEVNLGKIITVKPLIPQEAEMMKNPKSRSAKLRIIEK